jgi:hypothetical protein
MTQFAIITILLSFFLPNQGLFLTYLINYTIPHTTMTMTVAIHALLCCPSGLPISSETKYPIVAMAELAAKTL